MRTKGVRAEDGDGFEILSISFDTGQKLEEPAHGNAPSARAHALRRLPRKGRCHNAIISDESNIADGGSELPGEIDLLGRSKVH